MWAISAPFFLFPFLLLFSLIQCTDGIILRNGPFVPFFVKKIPKIPLTIPNQLLQAHSGLWQYSHRDTDPLGRRHPLPCVLFSTSCTIIQTPEIPKKKWISVSHRPEMQLEIAWTFELVIYSSFVLDYDEYQLLSITTWSPNCYEVNSLKNYKLTRFVTRIACCVVFTPA